MTLLLWVDCEHFYYLTPVNCYAGSMQVTVFGATGKVGSLVVSELLLLGHSVIAFTHTSALTEKAGVRTISGDIYDRASVEQALVGSGAVISALGSWGTAQKNVLSTAMQMLIPAMKVQGIKRVVSLTGNGAGIPGVEGGLVEKVNRLGMLLVAPKVLRDGEDHIRLLTDSELDWTVLRSPPMNNHGNTGYKLVEHFAGTTVNRQAVAKAMVDLVATDDWLRRAPFINRA